MHRIVTSKVAEKTHIEALQDVLSCNVYLINATLMRYTLQDGNKHTKR